MIKNGKFAFLAALKLTSIQEKVRLSGLSVFLFFGQGFE